MKGYVSGMIDNRKAQLERLQKEMKDDGQFANEPPKDDPAPQRPKPAQQ